MIIKKKLCFTVFLAIVSVGLMKTWPILLDPDLGASLKLYSHYLLGNRVKITDLLGPVDLACAVGPYDSYVDARFSKLLTKEQILAADNALKIRNEITSGSNNIFLAGFFGGKFESMYTSNFFANFATKRKFPSNVLNCIDRNGFIAFEKLNNFVSIKLVQEN